MKNDIQASCVEIPVPISVYVGLLDHLKTRGMDCEPSSWVAAMIREYLNDDRAKRPGQRKEPALDWSNDWLMFGAPPAVADGKTPRFGKQPEKPQGNDWCIGCACPSEDLLSSQEPVGQ